MTAAATFTLLRDSLPSWLRCTPVRLARGQVRDCGGEEWQGALIVVELGAVVLAGRDGGEVRLEEGAVFHVAGLERATVRNPGPSPALLCVARRAQDCVRSAPAAVRR